MLLILAGEITKFESGWLELSSYENKKTIKTLIISNYNYNLLKIQTELYLYKT